MSGSAIVIPLYNLGSTIAATVERLRPYGLPIYIVDDGSDTATQATLTALYQRHPELRGLRLAQNGGKGAAVMAGLRAAHADGCNHALQIDADGQHDSADVPAFLAASAAHPQAVISGMPQYDASAPKSRLYGRWVTRFWVWVETLSLSIGDAMLGFRLYPLAATLRLIDRVRIPTRMDFDIEILVRLAWDGVPVVNVPTRVIYPEGGLSHFDVWRDNLRISWMHTRLTTRMLLTFPAILWRRRSATQASAGRPDAGAPPAAAHWSRLAERGSALGLRSLIAVYRLLGDRAARGLLRLIVFWHWVFGRRARAASRAYLERLFAFSGGRTPPPTAANTYRHLLAFANSALDKVAGWRGRIAYADLDFPGRPQLEALQAEGRGALLLGAHLGNLEMLRALATSHAQVTINAVVYTAHAQRFTETLAASSERFRLNLLHVPTFGPDTAILLREKIERGEFLVIVGDRTPPAENGRVVSADFLGAPALFPQGPYVLAALLECPVYFFACVRERDGFHVHLAPFAERIELPRKTRQSALAEWARRYAQALETLCLRTPLQWFNFFDFWQAASPENPPLSTPPRRTP